MTDQQPDQRDEQHRPVTVDVDGTEDLDEPTVIGHGALQSGLHEHTGGALEVDDVLRVPVRGVDPGGDQPADPEVQSDGGRDQHQLSRDRLCALRQPHH